MSGKELSAGNTRREVGNSSLSFLGTIPYTLMEGPTFDITDTGSTTTEVYHLRSKDLEKFFFLSFPPPVIAHGSINYLPARRRMPGALGMVTTGINAVPLSSDKPGDPLGVDEDAEDGTYNDTYKVTITYETLKEFDNDPNDPESFLEISLTGGGQFISVPPGKMEIEANDVNDLAMTSSTANGDPPAGGVLPPEPNRDRVVPILKVVPTLEWQLKWKHAINPNWDVIIANLGRVNNDSIPLFRNPPKETLLYMGFSASQSYLWNGSRASVQPWTINYKFSQRLVTKGTHVIGWQHVYSPHKGIWVKVRAPDGGRLYETMSLKSFFR